MHGKMMGPSHYAAMQRGDMEPEQVNPNDLHYCGPIAHTPFCYDDPGNMDCICPGYTWRVERPSRDRQNMKEWWCIDPEWRGYEREDGVCSNQKQWECPGNNYIQRAIAHKSFSGGEGWEGNYCDTRADAGGNMIDYFWRLTEEALGCDVNMKCVDECGFGNPMPERRLIQQMSLQSTAPVYMSVMSQHRMLTEGVSCLAHSGLYVGACESIEDKDGCNSHKACVPRDFAEGERDEIDSPAQNDITAYVDKGITFKYTCGFSYGRGDSKALSLVQSPYRAKICAESEEASSMCPATCKSAHCNTCRDDRDFSKTVRIDALQIDLAVKCQDVAKFPDQDICGDEEFSDNCKLACKRCGSGCDDTEEAFNFKGEVHYCHEANGSLCGHRGYSRHCRDSCDVPCFKDGGGGEDLSCQEDRDDYLFNVMGMALQGMTDCVSLPNIFGNTGMITPEAVCSVDPNDPDTFVGPLFAPPDAYDGLAAPKDACPASCHAANPDAFPLPVCQAECPEELTKNRFVHASRNDDSVGVGKITVRNEDDCTFTVKFLDGPEEAGMEPSDLIANVDPCECDNGMFGVEVGDEIACVDSGYCAGTGPDGNCFAGEDICHSPGQQ